MARTRNSITRRSTMKRADRSRAGKLRSSFARLLNTAIGSRRTSASRTADRFGSTRRLWLERLEDRRLLAGDLTLDIDLSGNLVLADNVGAFDQLEISAVSGDIQIRNLNGGPIDSSVGTGSGTDTVLVNPSAFSGRVVVNSGSGDDVVAVNAGALAALGKNVDVNGGGDFDALTVTGGSFATATISYSNTNDGDIDLDGWSLQFTGLEPIDMTGSTATDIVFNLPGTDDEAKLEDDGNVDAQLTSLNSTFETTSFAAPSGSITINAGAGNDTVIVDNDLEDSGFTGTVVVNGQADDDYIFVVASSDYGATIDGGSHTAGDTLEVDCRGQFAVDNGSTVQVTGHNDIDYTDIETVILSNSSPMSAPTIVWVDDDWASLTIGQDPDGPGGAVAFGQDAFATINDALAAVDDSSGSGIINVYAGTYNETLDIFKNVIIFGEQDVSGAPLVHVDAGGAATGITVNLGFSDEIVGVNLTNFTGTGINVLGQLGYNGNVTGGLIGIAVTDATLNLNFSKVQGATTAGVLVSGPASFATIRQSEIIGTGSTLTGVNVTGGQAHIIGSIVTGNSVGVAVGALATGASAQSSNLAGNSLFAVQNASAAAVNASYSWWGTNSESAVQAKTSGLVDFTPYTDAGTDTDGGFVGWIGDYSKVHVTALGSQAAPLDPVTFAPLASIDRIQEGVNAVLPGGTTVLHAGTYTGNVQTQTDPSDIFTPTISVTLALIGQVNVTGNVTLDSNDVLQSQVNGTSAGQFGKLNVTGSLALGNATVGTTGSYVPAVGNSFQIINATGGVTGTFANPLVLINFVPAVVQYTPTTVTLLVQIPHDVWVNDTWIITSDVGPAGLSFGDTVKSNTGAGDTLVTGKIYGYNAYLAIAPGLAAVDIGGIVHILAGAYSGSVTVSKNVTIQGQGDSVTTISASDTNAVTIQAGKTVSLSGVKITNFCGAGIDNRGTLTLSSSTILNGLIGVNVNAGTLNMSSTIIKGALLAGVAVSGNGNATITTSEISSTCLSVIGVLVAGGQANISNSIITGNAVGLVLLSGHASIHDSNLAGNIIDAIENYTCNIINAEGNWFGSKKEKDIKNEIFGLVDYSPWLTNGTDHDGGARGFDG